MVEKLDHIAPDLRALAVPIDSLHPDPANARTGHAIDRIAASLAQYGQRKPLVVNRNEGNKIEAGNGTYQAARQLGWTHIAAVFVEDDPMTAVGYGVADNRLTDLSSWDTAVFDDMLTRSIPQYEVMRKAVYDLACQYRVHRGEIVDLGCSRGEAIAPLVDKFGATNRFIGAEISQPMYEAAKARFSGFPDSVVSIQRLDLRTDYPGTNAAVTLCVLTLQFTPIEYRLKILNNIYHHTIDGGALILVEKVLGASASLDEKMVNLYYSLKSENGYSEEQIQRKRMSLEGVLVPLTARMNEEMLYMTGFRQIDCFWRWMNFAGWIAVK